MRGLVLSDVHSNLEVLSELREKAKRVEFALLLGDLTNFGDRKAYEIIGALRVRKCFALPGNLDSWGVAEELSSMGISLHGGKVNIAGFVLVGFGGGLVGHPGRVLYSEQQIEQALEGLLAPQQKAVLATHLPPRNTRLDLTHSGLHVGSSAVRRVIERFQPALHLCGHIHEALGEESIGKTVCVNVGAVKEGKALVLSLGERVSFERIEV